jgi:hypothetical protein
MSRIIRWLPSLRIHSWGGFGSQLYVAYLIIRIQQKFPKRRIKVIIHTSGVTARSQEFDFSPLNVSVVTVDDFSRKQETTTLQRNTKVKRVFWLYFKEVSKFFLEYSRLQVSANDESSFLRIWMGTLTTRGHYTGLKRNESALESLYALLSSNVQVNSSNLIWGVTSIHFRLGDLLSLEGKHPVSASRVEDLISKYGLSKTPLYIFSDSERIHFESHSENSECWKAAEYNRLPPIDTLLRCVNSENFIGTTAKLSLWIAIFRSTLFNRVSFLPNELRWSIEEDENIHWF